MDHREKLIADLADYGREIFAGNSSFYFGLTERMQEDVRAGGPCWELLEPFASEPPRSSGSATRRAPSASARPSCG